MVKFISNVKNFKNILKLIKLNGKSPEGSGINLINNCALKFYEDKITCNVLNVSGVVYGEFKFLKQNIIENGSLFISNLEEFINYLERFNDNEEVEIYTEENIIIINGSKKAKIPSCNEDFVEDSVRAEGLKGEIKINENEAYIKETKIDNKITCNVEDIFNSLEDSNIPNIERKFNFSIENNLLKCVVGESKFGSIESFIKTKKIIDNNFGGKYKAGIHNVFNNLEGEVDIYLAKESPMIVLQKNENMEVLFLIAPIVEEQ